MKQENVSLQAHNFLPELQTKNNFPMTVLLPEANGNWAGHVIPSSGHSSGCNSKIRFLEQSGESFARGLHVVISSMQDRTSMYSNVVVRLRHENGHAVEKIVDSAFWYLDIMAKRKALHKEIAEFEKLPQGWDGDGGHAPAKQDIENALSIISDIPLMGMYSIRSMVSGDGDVGFEWGVDMDLEIGFSKGRISYYGYTPQGERIGDTLDYNGTMPVELERLLNAVFPN